MNLSRGLFRAWVFVSVVWVVLLAAFGWALIPETIQRERYQYLSVLRDDVWKLKDWNKPLYELVKSPSEDHLAPQFAQLEPTYWSDWDNKASAGELKIFSYPGDAQLYLASGWTDRDQRYIRDAFEASRWQRWALLLSKWAAGAVIPPALLFILGLALLWVGRGFSNAGH